ncbi:21013_t:CDS:2 [Gigaspora margarita]|uniref:21013_t:CDS:1 n=1 Tax=Gigaspora margarita TaxID=4874 RepID=A0ABM8VY50_GIGMA|nr:21013_t:CDS:2 [Gigaspora margarita]
MLLSWKYSKEKLAKHPYCTYIVRMKKVICHCGKVIKLGRRYDETFLNIHVNDKGCLAKQGVRSILNYFKLTPKSKKIKNDDSISSAEEWESDDDEKMDDNDLFKIDKINNVENDCESEVLSDDDMIIPSNNKWKPCSVLRSSIICEYISHTSAQFGGTRRTEVITKEIFLGLFPKEFSHKKLDCSQKCWLNHQLYAEAVWKIDRDCNCVRSMELKPLISKLKHTPKHYFENDPLKNYLKYSDLTEIWSMIKDNKSNTTSDVWIKLAEKGIQGTFNKKPVFESLCKIMLQAVIRKEKNMSKGNLKYTDDFKNFLVILGTYSPRVLDLF